MSRPLGDWTLQTSARAVGDDHRATHMLAVLHRERRTMEAVDHAIFSMTNEPCVDMASTAAATAGLVSVIMPCRNSAATISVAIDSVLSQSYVSIELIVVDDGSEDGSASIVLRYCAIDSRVVLLRNHGPRGVVGARNTALRAACGQYVCFLDSDDFLLPESIFLRVEALRQKAQTVTYAPYLRLLPNGDLVLNEVPRSVSFEDMLKKNFIGNLTGMYDAGALGKFDQHEIRHEDYLMWCQIIRRSGGASCACPSPVAVYRVSSSSLSGNKLRAAWWHWRVLVDGLSLGFPVALYFQVVYVWTSLVARAKQWLSGRG